MKLINSFFGLSLDDNSFSSTVVDYKFNNDGYKSGYDINGEVFGELIQTETIYDGGSRRFGETWSLGKYEKTVGRIMYYTDGTWCGPAGDVRKTQISWTCGDQFSIRSMTEMETCVYRIVATKECTSDPKKNGREPEDRVEKLSELLSEYLDLWFSAKATFAQTIQSRVDTVGQNMVKYFQSHKFKHGLCHQEDDEETDDLRFNRNEPCKGIKQLTNGYIKWASAYNKNPRRDQGYYKKVHIAMTKVLQKITKKLRTHQKIVC